MKPPESHEMKKALNSRKLLSYMFAFLAVAWTAVVLVVPPLLEGRWVFHDTELIKDWLFGGWRYDSVPLWANFTGVVPLFGLWVVSSKLLMQRRLRRRLVVWRARSHPMQVASAAAALLWTVVLWLGGSKWSSHAEFVIDDYDMSMFADDFRAWVFPVGLSCCVVYFMAGSAKRAGEGRSRGE